MMNFARNVYCILGLPFDAVSMSDSLEYIRNAASNNQSCFISTPNLNFVIACQTDEEFRNSVLHSQLSIADGMPIIWIAKMLGLPIRERVAGSDLYEKLSQGNKSNPLKVFFFGGGEGVAELACQNQNSSPLGVVVVGYETPGFGSVEEMSSAEIISKINASNADFVVVALGAKKGQAWIELNRAKLKAPIISHLGAVVNFVAGNVKRAPHCLQVIGVEWLWRIYQEPKLWSRYTHDGMHLCWIMLTKLLPYKIWLCRHRSLLTNQMPVQLSWLETDTGVKILIKGSCIGDAIEPLRELLNQLANRFINYELDLQEVAVLDAAFLGLCMLLAGHTSMVNGTLSLSNLNENNKKIINWNCANFLV